MSLWAWGLAAAWELTAPAELSPMAINTSPTAPATSTKGAANTAPATATSRTRTPFLALEFPQAHGEFRRGVSDGWGSIRQPRERGGRATDRLVDNPSREEVGVSAHNELAALDRPARYALPEGATDPSAVATASTSVSQPRCPSLAHLEPWLAPSLATSPPACAGPVCRRPPPFPTGSGCHSPPPSAVVRSNRQGD